MSFPLTAVFSPEQIDGDPARRFAQVAVGAEAVDQNSLFLLIEQEYMNSWLHLPQAVRQGVGVVVGPGLRPACLQPHPEITWVKVADPSAALLRLALLMRDASPARRIAVTGSNGKTTTKDMIAHLLRLQYKRTLKSYRNYNGELGVPLTLRKLRPDDQFLVAEVGMGDPGSVRRRAAWVAPELAVITNIGESHLLRFGSRQAIADEKGELLRALPPTGVAVLNGDDDQCRRLAAAIPQPTRFFGLGRDCDYRATDLQSRVSGVSFQLHHAGERYPVHLPVFGRYQVQNALAALAVADWAGLDLRLASKRFASFQMAEQRGKVTRLRGTLLIDDAYNSNPWSVRQAADSLAELPVSQRWLVLGDMQPLGPDREELAYRELAAWLADLSLTGILLIGPASQRLAEAYHGTALLQHFGEEGALVDYLLSQLADDSAVLLKGQDDRLFSRIAVAIRAGLGDV